MAKKHQIKISSKSGRSAANKSWRADVKEALKSQVSQTGYLEQAKKIARADRYAKNLAQRNKPENAMQQIPTTADVIRSRERATPNKTLVGSLVMLATFGKKPKLVNAILNEWFTSGDALVSVWQGNHWRSKRADSVNIFVPSDQELEMFNRENSTT